MATRVSAGTSSPARGVVGTDGACSRPSVTVAIVAYQSGDFMQALRRRAGRPELHATSRRDRRQRLDRRPHRRAEPARRAFPGRAHGRPTSGSPPPTTSRPSPPVLRGSPPSTPTPSADPAWLAALMSATARWPDAASFGSTQISLDDPDVLDGVGDVWHAAGIGLARPLPVAGQSPRSHPRARCSAPAPPPPSIGATCSWPSAASTSASSATARMSTWPIGSALAGWSAVQVPDAVVRHAGSGISGRTSEFTVFHGHRNRVWTWVKNTPGAVAAGCCCPTTSPTTRRCGGARARSAPSGS